MNGAAWTLRVAASGRGAARVSTRRHQFIVGRPLEFDAAAPTVSALEYALGAVGAEIVGGLQAFAKRRRVAIDEIEAVVDGEVDDMLAYLEVVGMAGQPRISRIDVRVFVSSQANPDDVHRVFDAAVAVLPLVATLRRALPLDIACVLTG
jgi:hypothetical protein